MKKFKFIFSILFVALLAGCSDEDNDTAFADNANAPQNLSALFTITQDNSGLVTIAPHGEGVVSYEVYFGDGTVEPAALGLGEKVDHVYAEGQYNVTLIATGINGKTTETTLPLTVTFVAPENLQVNIAAVVGNSLSINVSATADYETYFTVSFGEDDSLPPVQFNEGQTINYVYDAIGTYTVTVTAYSGGAATAVYTQDVTISNPMVLPINFENPTLNYNITTFNGATASVIANPNSAGINTSSKVGAMTPATGAVWTGGFFTLDTPVSFAAGHHFKMKVWSPAAGVPVTLKLENLTNANINAEKAATTTVANAWEELIFDFGGANLNAQYSKIVLFFNGGNPGTGDTYYFDDIAVFNGQDPVAFPLTFQSSSANYIWNNFGGSIGTKVNNPHMTGINTSTQVGQVVKNVASETWAGVAIPMSAPIDFSVMHKVKVKVWSPAAGIPVLMKFENMNPHNTAVDIEKQTTTTVANQWEELTFDFTGINNANNYQQLVLFFNFGFAGTGETYYFDDVQLSN
ncbi:hypothetical protein HYN59_16620 [Flavobacterium album]|uniref:PKD/Chitinase domain-containing protein n=1 Tax=Flavobacterium album TaxID=2175091 RepID=A0A2S1R280_9FLAO|nr:PKD domain-containing protein [Flavobacterium album]AWH86631.1 hypothetical protein HYN59_16620 [Flavobacterium album]